jgi:hypothetical protein
MNKKNITAMMSIGSRVMSVLDQNGELTALVRAAGLEMVAVLAARPEFDVDLVHLARVHVREEFAERRRAGLRGGLQEGPDRQEHQDQQDPEQERLVRLLHFETSRIGERWGDEIRIDLRTYCKDLPSK